MSALPSWAASYAALDDTALAALASRGLLRRARTEVAAGRVRLAGPTGAQERPAPETATVAAPVTVEVGQPAVPVVLLPDGPQSARCPCPVAGTCLHVVAACLLLRLTAQEEAGRAGGTPGTGTGRVAEPPLRGTRVPVAEAGAETEGDAARAQAPGAPRQGEDGTATTAGDPDGGAAAGAPAQGPLAEILGWEPAAVGTALGAAALRRVTAALAGRPRAVLARETTVSSTRDHVVVAWPGSPQVVVVPGLGPRGIIVAGRYSRTAEAAWRLEAVVRLFALHGRSWPWAVDAAGAASLTSSQHELTGAVLVTTETLVGAGLSHVGQRGAREVSRLAQQARLEGLPRLSRLLATAAGVLEAVASRQDGAQERDALSALAAAWSLATALQGSAGSDSTRLAALVGHSGLNGSEAASPGRLVPLCATWWHSAAGGRGLTVRFWDTDHARLESVTTGRAAGRDPAFQRSHSAPLLWGTSVGRLLSAPHRLHDARRRGDGSLAASTRTTAAPCGRLDDADLPAAAQGLASLRRGAGAAGFERPPPPVRLLLTPSEPRGQVDLDEVHQRYVWDVTDTEGATRRLHLEEDAELGVVAEVLARGLPLAAVVVEGRRPTGLFVRQDAGLRLLSPTMSTVGTAAPTDPVGAASGTRLSLLLSRRMDRLRRSAVAVPPTPPEDPLVALCRDVSELLTALAACGRLRPEGLSAYALARRSRRAREARLVVLATALEEVSARPGAAAVLRATAVLDRLRALVGC